MDKKLIALAVTSVFAAPAFGQASNVTLYGRANLGIDSYQSTGATAGSGADLKTRTRIFDASSRLGVRGVEDLGGGLRAIFQIESGVNMDSGGNTGQSGTVNGSSGFLGSRPSFVGLEGGFGRVTFGRQDVWWSNGTISQTGANFVNTDLPWLTGNHGRVSGGIARQSNVLQYTTPTFGGFNATASYSPDTTPTGGSLFTNTEQSQGGVNVDGRLLALTARWAGGPISVQFDYAQKQAIQAVDPATQRSKNTLMKGAVGFTYMPGSQISLLASRIKNDDVNAIAGLQNLNDDLKSTHISLSWEHTFGNIQAFAEFGQLGKMSGSTVVDGDENTKARGYMVGGRYNLSKRSAVYLTYNAIRNDANQNVDYLAGNMTSAAAPAVGADPRIIALGVWHQF